MCIRDRASAALLNALKVTGRKMGECKIVINGAGAAGISVAKLLLSMNFGEIVMCDIKGIIYEGADWLTEPQMQMAKVTNPGKKKGTLADALVGADVFIGVSKPNLVSQEMVATMEKDPIIFRCV